MKDVQLENVIRLKKLSTKAAILMIIKQLFFRLIAVAILLLLSFYLMMASNMGPAYFPNINGGSLDFPIRLSLVIASALIAIGAVVWLSLRSFQDSMSAYKTIKNQHR